MSHQRLTTAVALTIAGLIAASCGTPQTSPAPSSPSGSAAASAAPSPSAAQTVDDIGDITIEMWQHTYPPLQAWTEARLAEFKADHPNVTVELQAIPFQQYLDVLFTALASGEAPAFFETNEWTMTQFVEAKILAQLDASALGFDSLDAMGAEYESGSLAGATFDGALYGSPYDWSAPVLGVNNKLLADGRRRQGVPDDLGSDPGHDGGDLQDRRQRQPRDERLVVRPRDRQLLQAPGQLAVRPGRRPDHQRGRRRRRDQQP